MEGRYIEDLVIYVHDHITPKPFLKCFVNSLGSLGHCQLQKRQAQEGSAQRMLPLQGEEGGFGLLLSEDR